MAKGKTVRHHGSNIDMLRDAEGIFKLNAEVAYRTVDLRVSQQQLHGARVASFSVDLRCPCPAERMGALSAWL